MSLRGRLVLTLLGLLAAGLAVAALGSFATLRHDIVRRTDRQLTAVGRAMETAIGDRAGSGGALPVGAHGAMLAQALAESGAIPSLMQVRAADGGIVQTFAAQNAPPLPPHPAPAAVTARNPDGARIFKVGDIHPWRVRVSRLPNGRILLIGNPTRDSDSAIHHLARVEVVVSIAALAAVGLLARRSIRRGLRPLEEISGTARAIGAGDLSRRVEPAEPRTEVGRLGQALNDMLGQIETAFREREASEERLRRFVADASHELRTPVATVRGYAELFRRGAADRPDDLAKTMARIEAEAERMGVLVDELLLLARLDQGRPLDREPVDLARIAAEAVAGGRAVEPDRPIDLEAAEGAVVLGDAMRLRQVLDNLLANVRRHTPAGSPATVRIGAADGEVEIAVTDHGPGLTEDQCALVFERFYRTDSSRSREHGGAGLGLSIVAAVAEAHDGSVAVTSVPGEGTTFVVRLPRAPAAEARSHS
ncbi:sensor histidine kinase [Actinoallomurus rhizosphaericola]|uniref:sensor histidine kinase n=1 Tax=Actinoallomurus rhizosphaericola TaxID=2952536 RepID=UPI002093F5D9|nr:HAMP domain-containing sensor histidine kinase [Actinoallomurus rhizosphaericola]MCO5998220.1 HAMP domain-containing histidine kinase [Actinoallomurus rhizosphaericola]